MPKTDLGRGFVADYLKIPEVAQLLGLSEKTVRRRVRAGEIPSVFIGGVYRIGRADLDEYLEYAKVRPGKVAAPSSQEKLFNNGGLEEERHLIDAEVIADYERIVREHRIAWRDALEALAEPWEARIASGAFDRGMVEQFFTDVAAISGSVSRALRATLEEETFTRRKYKVPPSAEDIEEMWATGIAPAGERLLSVSDAVYAAAVEKFSPSELETVRRKRAEARRALGNAA
jgi:excisionase family DNA binding protein